MHEHLFIFRKPAPDEKLGKLRYSTDWQGDEAALTAALQHIAMLLEAHSLSLDDLERELKRKKCSSP